MDDGLAAQAAIGAVGSSALFGPGVPLRPTRPCPLPLHPTQTRRHAATPRPATGTRHPRCTPWLTPGCVGTGACALPHHHHSHAAGTAREARPQPGGHGRALPTCRYGRDAPPHACGRASSGQATAHPACLAAAGRGRQARRGAADGVRACGHASAPQPTDGCRLTAGDEGRSRPTRHRARHAGQTTGVALAWRVPDPWAPPDGPSSTGTRQEKTALMAARAGPPASPRLGEHG